MRLLMAHPTMWRENISMPTGQIDQPLPFPDIGDVARPLLVRLARREAMRQEIRRDVERMVAIGGSLELPTADDLDAVLAHQTADPTQADAKDQFVQLLGHARPAHSSAGAERGYGPGSPYAWRPRSETRIRRQRWQRWQRVRLPRYSAIY